MIVLAFSLEATFIDKLMMIGWVDLEALLSILWTIFHDARRFMKITCTKADLLDPKGMFPKIRSSDGLIRSMESSIIPR